MSQMLAEFRAYNAGFDNVPDHELAEALHADHFSNVPKEQFFKDIGLSNPQESTVGWGLQDTAVSLGQGVLNLGAGILATPQFVSDKIEQGIRAVLPDAILPPQREAKGVLSHAQKAGFGLKGLSDEFGKALHTDEFTKVANTRPEFDTDAGSLENWKNGAVWQEAKKAAGFYADNPFQAWNDLVQSAPSLAASMGAARIGAAGLTGANATKAATGAGIATGAILEGGDAGLEAMKRVEAMPKEQLQTLSEPYQKLINDGATHEQAVDIIARNAGADAFAVSAAISAISSKLTGSGKFEGDVARGELNKGFVSSVGGGTIKEGFQESIESAGGAFASNYGVYDNADHSQALGKGLVGAGVQGGMIGAGMGAGMGAFGFYAQKPQQEQPTQQQNLTDKQIWGYEPVPDHRPDISGGNGTDLLGGNAGTGQQPPVEQAKTAQQQEDAQIDQALSQAVNQAHAMKSAEIQAAEQQLNSMIPQDPELQAMAARGVPVIEITPPEQPQPQAVQAMPEPAAPFNEVVERIADESFRPEDTALGRKTKATEIEEAYRLREQAQERKKQLDYVDAQLQATSDEHQKLKLLQGTTPVTNTALRDQLQSKLDEVELKRLMHVENRQRIMESGNPNLVESGTEERIKQGLPTSAPETMPTMLTPDMDVNKGVMPEGFDDERITHPAYRSALREIADSSTKGGGISLVPVAGSGYIGGDGKEYGQKFTRTPSVNHEVTQYLVEDGYNAEEVKLALNKALDGKPLGKRASNLVKKALSYAALDDRVVNALEAENGFTMGDIGYPESGIDNAPMPQDQGDYGVSLEEQAQPRGADGGVRFSRTTATKDAYEARIDQLFSGEPANRQGVKVLDRSDMLDMLGYGDKPLILKESKVIDGFENHKEMTAEVWKKIPEWIDNPAAVFNSKTVTGRLVFVAPELLNGSIISVIIEPNDSVGSYDVGLLLNAYERKVEDIKSWAQEGLARYINNEMTQKLLGTSRLQLPRVNQGAGSRKILTEKNLNGYLKGKNNSSIGSNPATPTLTKQANQQKESEDVAKLRTELAGYFGTEESNVFIHDAKQPKEGETLSKIAAMFGKRIVWVSGYSANDFNGVVIGSNPDVIYLNVDAKMPLMAVLGHELLHKLQAESPKLYKQLRDAIMPLFTQEAQARMAELDQDHLDDTGRAMPRMLQEEELIADLMGDNFMNEAFWAKVAQQMDAKEKGSFIRFYEAVKRFLSDAVKMVSGFGSDRYVSDIKKAQDALVKAAALHMKAKMGDAKTKAEFNNLAAQFSAASDKPTQPEIAQAQRDLETQLAIADKLQAEYGYLPAPNGEKSNLNRLQWAQVRTPQFKEFYGDWEKEQRRNDPMARQSVESNARTKGASGSRGGSGLSGGVAPSSRVGGVLQLVREEVRLDTNGEPKVYYHGTSDDVSAFDTSHKNRKDKGWLGRGVYATDARSLAAMYARQKQGEAEQNVMSLFVGVKNPYLADKSIKNKLKFASQAGIDSFTQELLSNGYDGVAIKFPNGEIELVSFNPNAVKSAIGNVGTFSGKTGNIRYSKRGKGVDIYGFMDNIQKGLDQVTDMENNGGDGSVLYRQIKANFIGQLSQAGVSKAWLKQNADAVLGDMKSAAGSWINYGEIAALMNNTPATPAAQTVKPAQTTPASPATPKANKKPKPATPKAIPATTAQPAQATPAPTVKPPRQKPQATFVVPEFTIARKAQQILQNNFNRIKQIQNAIVAQNGKVDTTSDVYKAEERFWGKVGSRTAEFAHEMKKLVGDISKQNIDLADMENYLYARHAGERNEYIRTNVDANNQAGSGMTDKEATDIIKTMEAKHQGISKLADKFDAMTAETRKMQLQSGLISFDTYDKWSEYKHYVPLQGFADEDLEAEFAQSLLPVGKGRGYDVRGSESKKAMGRTTLADDLMENMYQQRLQAITRSAKNEVTATLFNLVSNNPNPALWEVNAVTFNKSTNQQGTALLRFATQQERDDYLTKMGITNAQTGFDGSVYTAQFSAPVAEVTSKIDKKDTVAVKIGGKEVFIKIKDKVLLEQFAQQGVYSDLGIVEPIAQAQNLLKRFYTSLNPEFTVINFMRDVMTGFVSMPAATNNFSDSLKFLKNLTTIKSAWKYAHNKQDATLSPEMKDLVNRYLENGGSTGYMDFQDAEKLGKRITNMWLDARKAKDAGLHDKAKTMARLSWDLTAGWIERSNEALEMATRLAAFKTAVEAGKTDREAASIAKNITVNFNRKGDYARQLDLFMMFFNPAIQGTVRVIEIMKHPKSATMLTGLVFLGMMTAIFAGDEEDEEGNKLWDILPDENKMKTLPLLNGLIDGNFAQVQMPYGVNFFTNIGYAMGDVYRHYQSDGKAGKSPAEAAEFTMNAMALHLNPFGGLGAIKGESATFMPIPLKVWNQIENNTSWTGKPLRPEDTHNQGKNDATPDSQKFFAGQEDNPETKLAQWLSQTTGGDGVKSGVVEIAPSSLNLIMSSLFGGVWSMGKATTTALSKANNPNEEVELRDIPIVRKMVGGIHSGMYSADYRTKADEIKGVMSQYENYLKDGNFAQAQAFSRENMYAIEDSVAVKAFDKELKRLRTHRNLIFAQKSLSDDQRQALLTENKKLVEDTLKKAVKALE